MCRRPSGTEWPTYPGPSSKFTQTQLILHPQAPPWGRNPGQQDTPSTTVKERKVALNFLLPLLLFLPYMSPTSSSFREYSECPIYLPGCTQLSWEAGWGEFEAADWVLRSLTVRLRFIPLGPSLSAVGPICRNAPSTQSGSPVNESRAPQLQPITSLSLKSLGFSVSGATYDSYLIV